MNKAKIEVLKMVPRIGIVKLVLGIAGLIAAVQVLVMFHFSSLHTNDGFMKIRKSVSAPERLKDQLGPHVFNSDRLVDVYDSEKREKFQVI